MAGKRSGKQAYRENERKSWPAWLWLGLGVLLGLTLSAVMLAKEWVPMLHRKNLPQPNPEATAPKEGDQAVADDAAKKPAPPKKTYDFYSVLPEMEVVIPDAELSAKAKAEQQRQQQAMAQSQTANPNIATPPTATERRLPGSPVATAVVDPTWWLAVKRNEARWRPASRCSARTASLPSGAKPRRSSPPTTRDPSSAPSS